MTSLNFKIMLKNSFYLDNQEVINFDIPLQNFDPKFYQSYTFDETQGFKTKMRMRNLLADLYKHSFTSSAFPYFCFIDVEADIEWFPRLKT